MEFLQLVQLYCRGDKKFIKNGKFEVQFDEVSPPIWKQLNTFVKKCTHDNELKLKREQ